MVGAVLVGAHLSVPVDSYANAVLAEVVGVCTVVFVVVGVRLHRPAKPVLWYLMASGQLVMTLGDAVFDYFKFVVHTDPYPSAADFLYLLYYPLTTAALFVLIRGRTAGRDREGLLDAAIIATGFGLLSWVFLMEPLAGDSTSDVYTRFVDLAYPASDVLLLAMLARTLTTPGGLTCSFRLLAASQVLQLVGDVLFGVLNMTTGYESGPVDDIWLVSYVLLGASALHPSMRRLSQTAPERAPVISRLRLGVLAVTSLIAPAILFWQGSTHRPIDWLPVSGGSVVLFLLVVARISGLVSQVRLQAEKLAALAHRDALTGIANRRAWDLELPREIVRARREHVPVSVALLDIDHFKRYNDQHGHQAGDELLRTVAAKWSAQLRPGDMLARYGGEEFGVVLPGSTTDEAVEVIDRLRQATAADRTFSAGVATWNGVEGPDQLIARADTALYQAKRDGRDRVHATGSGEASPTADPAAPHPTMSQLHR